MASKKWIFVLSMSILILIIVVIAVVLLSIYLPSSGDNSLYIPPHPLITPCKIPQNIVYSFSCPNETNSESFGSSLVCDAKGVFLFVGQPLLDGGFVYVYKYSNQIQRYEFLQTIESPVITEGSFFATTLYCNSEGTVLTVSGILDNVWIYQNNNPEGSWNLFQTIETSSITPSTSLNSLGNVLAIGEPLSSSPFAKVYQRASITESFKQIGEDILIPSPTFGICVSPLSESGITTQLAIALRTNNVDIVEIQFYAYGDPSWILIQSQKLSTGSQSNFEKPLLKFNGNGNVLFLALPSAFGGDGAIFTDISTQTSKFSGSFTIIRGNSFENFGSAFATCFSGRAAFVSALNTTYGSVYEYKVSNNGRDWKKESILQPFQQEPNKNGIALACTFDSSRLFVSTQGSNIVTMYENIV